MKTTNSRGGTREGHQAKQQRRKSNLSSRENEKPKKSHEKGFKTNLKIDRQQILEYPQICCQLMQNLKATKEVVVQDIKLTTDNVLFRKQKYYSPSEGKTY